MLAEDLTRILAAVAYITVLQCVEIPEPDQSSLDAEKAFMDGVRSQRHKENSADAVVAQTKS